MAKEETAAESVGLADGETPTSDTSATEPEVEIAAQAAAPEAVKKPRRRRKKAEPVAVAEVAPDVTPQATLPEISAPISEGATPVSESSVETLVGHPDPAPQPEQPITSPPVDAPPVEVPPVDVRHCLNRRSRQNQQNQRLQPSLKGVVGGLWENSSKQTSHRIF